MNYKTLLFTNIVLLICVFNIAYTSQDNGNIDGYYDVVGEGGINPSSDGADIGDWGPVYDSKTYMNASLTLWITSVDDWEQKGSKKSYRRKYNKKNNYNDDDDNDDNDDKEYDKDYDKNEHRRKRSHSKVRFPVTKIENFRKFPFHRFPPLLSIAPWLPIFYDRLTMQTIIFSPIGGLYIIPPLINFYGKRFAVAQLIKWGYASLVSSGLPPPPAIDVAPLVQPTPAGGPPSVGVVGSKPIGQPPVYDSRKNQYQGGVRTDFPNFRERNNGNYLASSYNNAYKAGGVGTQ